MNDLLKDKVIIITGGGGVLGSEFAKAVAENGGIGVIADINEEAALKVRQRFFGDLKGDRLDTIKLDITDKGSILAMIDQLVNKYGRIDALVNNAYPRNKNYGRNLEDVTYADFCENIDQHLGGYFLVSQQLAKYFIEKGHGNIINISSIYGVIAPRFEIYEGTIMTMPVEYAVNKSALIHLTKYFAKYYRDNNIRVNSISLGGLLADQPKIFLEKYKTYCLSKGMLNSSDVKGTLVYLLSDLSEYVNGQNIIVDDGFTL